jgi:hypothetical protein
MDAPVFKYHRELTKQETEGVLAMKALCEKHEFKNAGKDVGELLRFLRAREFKIADAWTMYETHIKWRESYKPESITPEQIPNEIKLGKVCLLPPDKLGRPSMVLLAAKHLPGVVPFDETVRYITYMLEMTIKNLPSEVEQIVFIYDRTDFERKNFDLDLIKAIAAIVEANYPERVGNVLILKPNWLFNLLFALVKPFVPNETEKKIKVIESPVTKELLKYYNEENLWERWGGKYTDGGLDSGLGRFTENDDKDEKPTTQLDAPKKKEETSGKKKVG